MPERLLLDTNIIIHYLQGEKIFVEFLDKKIKAYAHIFVSTISVTELYSKPGIKKSEVELIEDFLLAVNIAQNDYMISKTAGFIRQNIKIKTPDAIIAATAICINAKLVTENKKDFKNIPDLDLEVVML